MRERRRTSWCPRCETIALVMSCFAACPEWICVASGVPTNAMPLAPRIGRPCQSAGDSPPGASHYRTLLSRVRIWVNKAMTEQKHHDARNRLKITRARLAQGPLENLEKLLPEMLSPSIEDPSPTNCQVRITHRCILSNHGAREVHQR
jgi:hypothetical protein